MVGFIGILAPTLGTVGERQRHGIRGWRRAGPNEFLPPGRTDNGAPFINSTGFTGSWKLGTG